MTCRPRPARELSHDTRSYEGRRRDNGRHAGLVDRVAGTAELLQIRPLDQVRRGVSFGLNQQPYAGGCRRDHVGPEIAGTTDDLDVAASVPHAQEGERVLELRRCHQQVALGAPLSDGP
jgi:hypothetical protein